MLSHTTPHTRTHWPPAHCAASVPVVVASRDPARAAAVSLDVVVVAEGCLKLPRQQRTGAVQTEVLYESDWFLLFRHTHTWLLCWNCRRGVWNKGQRWPWEFACIVLLRTVSDPNAPIHPPREQLLSVHFFPSVHLLCGPFVSSLDVNLDSSIPCHHPAPFPGNQKSAYSVHRQHIGPSAC